MPSCCGGKSLAVWSWNACSLRKADISPFLDNLRAQSPWDIILLQEGLLNHDPGTFWDNQFWLITGESPTRGAPAIITTPRLGRLLKRTIVAENHVLASFALRPPLIAFSLYLPNAALGPEAFNKAIDSFSQDLHILTQATPGCRLLGGGDLNTQLSRFGSRIGSHVGTGERSWEASRTTAIRNLLTTHDLRVPSTFAPYRYTRSPWPAKFEQEKPTVIDFLFASPNLRTELWPCTQPLLGVRSDHRPIGLAVVATPPKRQLRKIIWNHRFAPPPDWNSRIPTNWQPAHPGQWARDLREMKFDTLHDLAPTLLQIAKPHQTRRTEAQQETHRLREAAYHTAQDPIMRMAYQIRLHEHQEQQRRHREYQRLLEQARGQNWDFAKPSKTPTAAKIPADIEGHTDREKWGETLGSFLSNLYNCDESEAQRIHDLAWNIQNQASLTTRPPLICHPNDLRDIIKSLPNYRAAGKDGIPSQILKDLPYRHIITLASLFQQLANDTNFRSEHRPTLWEEALVTMLPKTAGATSLNKYRPISLMTQTQKLFTKWILSQCTTALDQQIDEHQSGFRRHRQAAETLYTIQRTIELHLEWATPLTILKVDLQKAFDSIYQSTILTGLTQTDTHPLLSFNLCRELLGNKISPQIWGCTPDSDIPLKRGSKLAHLRVAPSSSLLSNNYSPPSNISGPKTSSVSRSILTPSPTSLSLTTSFFSPAPQKKWPTCSTRSRPHSKTED